MQAVSQDYDESDYFIYFLYLLRLNIVICRTSVESLRNPSGGTYSESRYKVALGSCSSKHL